MSIVASICLVVWWLEVSLYDLMFTPPLVAHLDVILIPFIVAFFLLLWILYDVVALLFVKDSCT